MKKIIVSFAALVCVFSCFAQNCAIHGHINISEVQGKEVSVINILTDSILSTTTIRDSAFTFNIPVNEPFWCKIKTENIDDFNYYYLTIVAEPGTVTCDLVTDELTGTPTNERYSQYSVEMKRENAIMNDIAEQYNTEYEKNHNPFAKETKSLADELLAQMKKTTNLAKNTFIENKDNLLATEAFNYLIEMLEYKFIKYNELNSLWAEASPLVRNYPPLAEKMKKLDNLNLTAAGKPYIDLDLTDFKTGKSVKLSDYIDGKIALIDFWASWCKPCREEIPNIAQIYDKYGKDIVVISLNVWDKPDAQAKAIHSMKMNWTQLSDSTKNATNVYDVKGIPHIMLIGKDGKILDRDLRGEEIEIAVQKALK